MLLAASACSKNDVGAPLEHEQVVKIYLELLTYALNHTSPDSVHTLESVLKAHGLTKEEFERRIARYEDDPEAWFRVANEVMQRLQEMEQTNAAAGDLPQNPPQKK